MAVGSGDELEQPERTSAVVSPRIIALSTTEFEEKIEVFMSLGYLLGVSAIYVHRLHIDPFWRFDEF